tara:strand:- start:512 stop:952 length:441 start_codon:yes stop_codon:yes gene_type:complete
MKKQFYMILVCSIFLCGCVTTHSKVGAITRPTVVIQSKNKEAIKNKIIEVCDRKGLVIDEETSSSVSCSGEASMLTQALFRSRYSTDIRNVVKFTIITVKNSTKVSARLWSENQNVYGQQKRSELDGQNNKRELQEILNAIKKEVK